MELDRAIGLFINLRTNFSNNWVKDELDRTIGLSDKSTTSLQICELMMMLFEPQ